MKLIVYLLLMLLSTVLSAQNSFKAIVKDSKTKQAIIGATAQIASLKVAIASDSNGHIIFKGIPNGKLSMEVSHIGYVQIEQSFYFPFKGNNDTIVFLLEPKDVEFADVIVQSTRTNQNIKDVPTRIEALPLEELDEKSAMRPGDIKMLLGESTGITVQSTSAVSGTANFRIQGLDSRYTQLLKDGMPLYQGFSGGLSILQITPLDLKQVEYIKGSASTLFGGGAIAGLVNLISKIPNKDPELTFLLNGTNTKGADISGFYAKKGKHFGTTIFGCYNYNSAYDPSNQGFSAIPKTNRISFNPKIFYTADEQNSGWMGVNAMIENRLGGDMKVIEDQSDFVHQYFEKNESYRYSTQLSFTHKINEASKLNFKNTIGYFNRKLSKPNYAFAGKQLTTFSEFNFVDHHENVDWVAGANLVTDHFTTTIPTDKYNYSNSTIGLFAQNTYRVSKIFSFESGLRGDYNTPSPNNKLNGIFILPRINGLFRINAQLTSRIGGGLGYKMPSLFNDESEVRGYESINPISIANLKAEQSVGGNADINYRMHSDETTINVNELFFYTVVNNPLLLQNNTYTNAEGNILTQGAETNIKLSFDELNIYLGYTYTDTKQHFAGKTTTQPLTAKDRVSVDVTYEIEGKFRAGVEAFYTGQQLLNDGAMGKAFITYGLLLQKMTRHFDIFINAENLTDRRQSRWDNIYSGTVTNPIFKDIYTPLEGAVINLGLKIKVI